MSRPATSFAQLISGRFVTADLLEGQDRTVTIKSVELEALPTEKGGEETKGVVSFNETDRGLVLNRTNAEALRAMFGAKLALWVGKRITLYPTTTRRGPETVPCIRVRGSPDLAQDMTFELRLPRKRPEKVTLKKTT